MSTLVISNLESIKTYLKKINLFQDKLIKNIPLTSVEVTNAISITEKIDKLLKEIINNSNSDETISKMKILREQNFQNREYISSVKV